MKTIQWLLCPACKSKTRLQIREDTELKSFPLDSPKMQTGNLDMKYPKLRKNPHRL